MIDGLLCITEHFCKQKETTDNQASPPLSSLAMYGDHRWLEEVLINGLDLLLLALISMVVSSETCNNIIFNLYHSLQKQENVETNIKDLLDTADLMVTEWIHLVSELWDIFLGVPLRLLNAQIINLNVNTVTRLEEFDHVFTLVTD